MRKLIFCIISVMTFAFLAGSLWNLNRNKEHSFESYQREIAKRDKKIGAFEDSISRLQSELELYVDVLNWVTSRDSN